MLMIYFHLKHDQACFLFHFRLNSHPRDNSPFLIFLQIHHPIPLPQSILIDSKFYVITQKKSCPKLNSLYHQNALQKNL